MTSGYKDSDRMSEIISTSPSLLQMMCRFGIPLGVGEKTVREVCEESNVHTGTFLAVANQMSGKRWGFAEDDTDVSVAALVGYLSRSHHYFLNFQLPGIRRKLLEALDCSQENQVAYLILKFYDEYMGDVRRHMQHENKKIFTYVERLLSGIRPDDFEIARFARSHEGIDKKLQELKNIIIKYYSPETTSSDLLSSVLFDIFNCEADLRSHCEVEDALFVPAVQRLEAEVEATGGMAENQDNESEENNKESLSEREKEIVGCVVRGMTGKEIADRLFISVNTVLTHRKNISRKLNIHSVAGLTIYAIVNGLVNIDELHAE
ncbi:MAG: helix-turn-helix transcriptional regulator [Bacteroidaceae bacterium]|nr:helix-turn-helix transcriptional regulator [Bacteroidaceae bacterium]